MTMRASRGLYSATVLAGMLILGATAMAQVTYPQQNRGVGAGMNTRAGGPLRPGEPAPLSGDAVQVTKLLGTGRQTLIKSPEYKTSIPKSSTRPKDWVQISVKFDTVPEWIGVLTIEYIVMTLGEDAQGKRVYSLYRQTVEHLDVEQGRDHLSAVFIPPPAVKRYGMPVAVHVNVSADGQAMAAKADDDDIDSGFKGQLNPGPSGWWQDRAVLDKVTVRDGYLWKLAATPFAYVNADDYEVMR